MQTLSYLPPLEESDIRKQLDYLLYQNYIPCIEFSEPEHAYTLGHGPSGLDSSVASGYYDNRYWPMWKLPLFGCQDSGDVLSEVNACATAYPNSFIRVIGFDANRQVQCMSFLVRRPPSATERAPLEDRSRTA
jgi:ribulose-bisphosphate carboxylase small chain